jgi:hypothetical protein
VVGIGPDVSEQILSDMGDVEQRVQGNLEELSSSNDNIMVSNGDSIGVESNGSLRINDSDYHHSYLMDQMLEEEVQERRRNYNNRQR